MRKWIWLAIGVFVILAVAVFVRQRPVETAGEINSFVPTTAEAISTNVCLVLWPDQGIAAIRLEKIDLGEAVYSYRFLSASDPQNEISENHLKMRIGQTEYSKRGFDYAGNTDEAVKIGSISVRWTCESPGNGWLIYTGDDGSSRTIPGDKLDDLNLNEMMGKPTELVWK